MVVVEFRWRCHNQCTKYMTATGAANMAKRTTENIIIFFIATLPLGQQFVPSHADACSGYTTIVEALSAIA